MKRTLSTSAIARMLGVSTGSIANWIDQGQMRAARTPGGHRRVSGDEVVRFLTRHHMPIPPELSRLPRRVLIVDDDAEAVAHISKLIQSHYPACEVLDARDGFSAGELAVAMKPDAVVLDLAMEGIDGFEICGRLKARPETSHAVVIAVTALDDPDTKARIVARGARACLLKPLDCDALISVLDEVLPGREVSPG